MKRDTHTDPKAAASVDSDDLEVILDQVPDSVVLSYGRTDGDSESPDKVVAVVHFSERGFGFGEISIRQTPEGCFVDTECMGREQVKKYLCALVDGAVVDTDEDPEKHRLYNRVAGRRCGAGCRVCAADGVSE